MIVAYYFQMGIYNPQDYIRTDVISPINPLYREARNVMLSRNTKTIIISSSRSQMIQDLKEMGVNL